MAECIANYIMMRHYFPEHRKNFKLQEHYKSLFMTDMQFNLGNGKVA